MPLTNEEMAALAVKGGWAASAPAMIGPPAPPPPQAPPPTPAAALPPVTAPIGSTHGPIPGDPLAHGPSQPYSQVVARASPDQTVGYSGADKGIDPSALMSPAAEPTPQVTTGSSSSVTKGVPLSAQTKAERDKMLSTQDRASKLEEQGFEDSRKAQYMGAAIAANQQAVNAQATAAEATGHATDLAGRRAAIEALQKDVETGKVDPEHFWHTRSTGAKIAGILGMAFGGFASGFHGGPNQAADFVEHLVDNDIAAQKANLENKARSLTGKASLYQMTEGAFKSEEERHAAARAMALTGVQKQIDAEIQRRTDPLEKAHLLDLRSAVEQRTVQTLAHLDEQSADKKSFSSHSSSTSGGQPAAQGGLDPSRIVRGPGGQMMYVGSPKGAEEINKAQANRGALDRDVKQIQALRDLDAQYPGTNNHAKLQAAVESARNHWMALHEKRMPGEALKQAADQAIGSPDSLLDWHAPARLQGMLQSVDSTIASDFQFYGAIPIGDGHLAVQGNRAVMQAPNVPVLPPARGGHKGR